ncbi:peptidase domain-containing ABC transporter [Falsiroseomonas selenitidurans]|uniref:Peptidase domain-containing ABC transporter n=1 Tax=Falsiroseomonas selenitidurans TaxID=2716335 RepID=A0ABX1DXW6_9PROT|nr:peptidase domain-containing ABC transporter [Falsiroseomonas selenitidurans]NKC29750.1 peptidase domain-containing ABC transporter [Falsiroseomonas selenitidurans]
MTLAEKRLAPELTALRGVFLLAMHHGLQLAPDELPQPGQPDMVAEVLRALRAAGLKAQALRRGGWARAAGLGTAYPALAQRLDGSWVILVHTLDGADGAPLAAVLDPAAEQDGIQLLPQAEFLAAWNGTLVLARRVHALADEAQPFGLRWFLPEIIRHRACFAGVAVAALVGNLIGFAIPLLFQVLIDKVIAHQAWQTLTVVVAGFVLLTGFDAVFAYVRQRLMLLASNKIDARLGSRTFAHLLALPLAFFEGHAAGVLVRHMQQTEKLRHFLTGRLFQTLLDAMLLPLLLLFLVLYSGALTAVVLGFSLAIALVIGVMVPTFRARLNRLYATEGARQAHLVETLHNMRAVKSLVLEPVRQAAWDQRLAAAVRQHEAVGRIGALGSAATGALEKLMQIAVLALGATLVFDGALSMGALVAFTMLSGRVTGPLVQIVALINEYQEAALSVRMLGTVMNATPEARGGMRQARPPITGRLVFEQVRFAYPGAAMPALDGVSFQVAAGQVVGVVGRSGSGKTTITRLVQAIQAPQSGLIQLDGVDLRHIDLDHLRRSIGVVLQDNLLFRGSIRDNIAAARPDAPMEEVIEAARLAGAAEFIDRLPHSYATIVEEGASNFSGGQRQRIAIARALLTRPRLLIFDEATSALDPDSEAIIQRNLAEIAQGRTMLIVSHRLSSLVQADAILVLEQGRLLDCAPHAVLLERCAVYRHLWQQQTQHLR